MHDFLSAVLRVLASSTLLFAASSLTIGCDSADEGVGGTTGSAVPDGSNGANGVGSTGSSFGPGSSTGGVTYDDDMPTYFPSRCPQSATWSLACLTVRGHDLVGFNPESGESCVLGADLPISEGTLNGLALIGDTLVGCMQGTESLLVVDVVQGTAEMHPLPAGCTTITDSNDILYYQILYSGTPQQVTRAASVAEMLDGPNDDLGIAPLAMRYGARAGLLYTAVEATSVLEKWDIASETQLGSVQLQGFDSWVWGIAPVDDGRIVVLSDGRVLGFSADGAQVFVTPVDFTASASAGGGLRCFSPMPMPVPS